MPASSSLFLPSFLPMNVPDSKMLRQTILIAPFSSQESIHTSSVSAQPFVARLHGCVEHCALGKDFTDPLS